LTDTAAVRFEARFAAAKFVLGSAAGESMARGG
jgi:hypothetical protein